MTTPDIEPAAGTGGAAECRFCGCTALPPAVPCATAEKALAGCPWLSREERAEVRATLTPDAPAPSAVPERAVGGGGLPTVEEMAEALWETASITSRCTYAEFAAANRKAPGMAFTELQNRAHAILARLAQPRPAAADEGDLRAAVLSYRTTKRALDALDPEETPDDPGGEAHASALREASEEIGRAWRNVEAALGGAEIDAASGRVDAGAMREAGAFLLDRLEELSTDGDAMTEGGARSFYGHVVPAMAGLRAALDVALDRAGEGWSTVDDAPTAGEPVWVWGGAVREPQRRQADGEWWRLQKRQGSKSVITHWRHDRVPTPPSTSTEPSP